MVLTREILEKRLALLQAQYQQNVNNANACQGAIQQVEWALAELDKPEPGSNGRLSLADELKGD